MLWQLIKKSELTEQQNWLFVRTVWLVTQAMLQAIDLCEMVLVRWLIKDYNWLTNLKKEVTLYSTLLISYLSNQSTDTSTLAYLFISLCLSVTRWLVVTTDHDFQGNVCSPVLSRLLLSPTILPWTCLHACQSGSTQRAEATATSTLRDSALHLCPTNNHRRRWIIRFYFSLPNQTTTYSF